MSGPEAGPMDPIIEELQRDYHAIGDLVNGAQARAASIIYELSKARPNVDTIKTEALKIAQGCKSLRRIMQLPEVH